MTEAAKVAMLAQKYTRPSYEIPADTRGTMSFGQRLGLVFVSQTAFISLCLVAGLLAMVIYEAVKRWRLKRFGWPPQIYMYFVCLLVSDLIQAIGSFMDVRWIHLAGVVEGSYCTTQGVIKQLGDVGVALTTIAIAIHTFGVIAGRWTKLAESPYVGLGVVGFIWIFLTFIVGLAVATHRSGEEPFYGNTQYWCSIRSKPYKKLFIGLEYAWLWVAMIISFILYTAVAVIVYRQHILPPNASTSTPSEKNKQIRKLAFQMIFYPIIYIITVLPQSVVRFMQFNHPFDPPPFQASAFAAILFASSGFLNVLLYVKTRPSLIPHDPDTGTVGMEKIPDGGLASDFHFDYQDSFGTRSRPDGLGADYTIDYDPPAAHYNRRNTIQAGGLDD